MAASWVLLLLLRSWSQAIASSYGRGRDGSAAERDGWEHERDRDLLYGGLGYRDRDYYGTHGMGYKDYYGGGLRDYYGAGDLGSERKEAIDDCHRIEAHGVPLAEALREAAELLGNASAARPTPELHQLLEFFAGAKHRQFLLANCPQAVVLATFLQSEFAAAPGAAAGAAPGAEPVEKLRELLAAAPSLRPAYRTLPQWTGEPWEPLLRAVQQRTGVVLFPMGEQQFHVERIAVKDWVVHPRRRCAGRRDLGNLQATPLASCLEKCMAHPLCKSATFWHWQPGGFGFEQRCFLSSTCTEVHAIAEGADGAVLFEKQSSQSPREEALMRRTIVAPGGAPWAPRCGHRMVATSGNGRVHLWVLAGAGVDPFANTSTSQHEGDEGSGSRWGPDGSRGSDVGGASEHGSGFRSGARHTAGLDWDAKAAAELASYQDPPKKREPNATVSSVVEAYLSRHVELNGELPPLRSLPYGRLADVWRSDDLGSTWNLVTSEAPWGRRAFFGAVPVWGGRALLVLGGVHEPTSTGAKAHGSLQDLPSAALPREYMNDVWLAQLDGGNAEWHQMSSAPWTVRAGFEVLSLSRQSPSQDGTMSEEVLVLGGRSADGSLMNDVWAGAFVAKEGSAIQWRRLTAAAPWVARADFASAASMSSDIWIMGGCDQAGRALMDVWWSSDGQSWVELVQSAPWGPRIGAAAVSLDMPGSGSPGPVLLFGGYAYPDTDFGTVPVSTTEATNLWASASWVSHDGVQWQPLNVTRMSWAPNAMHAALVAAPCGGNRTTTCAYAAGGLTHEGYYDNSVHRLLVSTAVRTALWTVQTTAATPEPHVSSHAQLAPLSGPSGAIAVAFVLLVVFVVLVKRLCCARRPQNGLAADGGSPEQQRSAQSMDPRLRFALCSLFCAFSLLALIIGYLLMALSQLSQEIHQLRTEAPHCEVQGESAGKLLEVLGLRRLTEQWDHVGTLLRLALREPQFGYGSLGGYGDTWRGPGRAGDGFGSYSSRSYDRGYGLDGGYAYGGYSGLSGAGGLGGLSDLGGPGGYGGAARGDGTEAEGARGGAAAQERELALLPTTQGLSCRSPRCDRNASTCAGDAPRSLASPYGCCSDYMLLMLRDVTEWLGQQRIPYFVTYGTLLGALRDREILPYTQDMDIVVDRVHWPRLQRGLEAAEFFGGRRYLFGVDQWEERVSRICADWEGFAASTIGGPDGDHLGRGTEFHMDIYASDWWQIKELHLIDCVEPLGTTVLPIHGQNFSAPARPRACVEKLYGADWRTPKHALSGVN